MAWAGKRRYFIAAACLLLMISLLALARTALDKVGYAKNGEVRQEIGHIVNQAAGISDKIKELDSKSANYKEEIEKACKPFQYRQVVPELQQTLLSVLPNARTNPEQKDLYEAFGKGDVEAIVRIPRKERRQIFVTEMSAYFSDNLAKAKFGVTATMRRALPYRQARRK